ncbi:ABC transporter permease [Candidatus Falkowbacteria bacterium]|nr:ABC transporter permease [Candidatus Falkowbacteria bacterium]
MDNEKTQTIPTIPAIRTLRHSNIKPIYKRELGAYFNSPIAYIFIGVFLVVGNWLFFQNFFLSNQASMRMYFGILPWIFLFLTPAITMRVWAEEKQSGTEELLLTLPVRDADVVMAKFLASLTFLAISLGLTLSIPISVASLGSMDLGPVIGGYIGAILLGGAYLALGLFISSLTKNQIVAFILGLAACFLVFIIGADFVTNSMPGWLGVIFSFFGISSHFYNIARGVLDSRDVIYYLTFIGFFLWLNVKAVESRNWR